MTTQRRERPDARLSRNLEKTLRRSLALANALRHEYATLEHLLKALLDDEDALPLLEDCGADIERLRSELSEFLEHELRSLVVDGVADAKPTAGFQRVVQRAAIHVQAAGSGEISGANVLVSLFSERESHAFYFLSAQGVTRLDVVRKISGGRDDHRAYASMDLDLMLGLVEECIPSSITFVADTVGDQATLDETQEMLDVLKTDVNWAWRISEAISRIAFDAERPYWIDQTIQDLAELEKLHEGKKNTALRINALEFDPLDDTFLERPLISFIYAKKINPLEVTIAVTAASLTVVIVGAIWALRTWKQTSSEVEYVRAKVDFLQRISSQITCKNTRQLKEIEGLILGVLNCPGGLHERGEEISLSIPHLLEAKVGTSTRDEE